MTLTVVLCTDGSEASFAALEAGLACLGRPDSVVVASVIEPVDVSLVTGVSGFGTGVMPPGELNEIVDAQHERGRATLESTVQHLGLTAADHGVVETRLLEGDPGRAICDLAEEIAADVVVMGTRGHGGLRRAVLGSVSDFVVRHAPCSVLITNERDEG